MVSPKNFLRLFLMVSLLIGANNLSAHAGTGGDFSITAPTRVSAGTYASVTLNQVGISSGWCRFVSINVPQFPGRFTDPGFFKLSGGNAKVKMLAITPGTGHLSFICSRKSAPTGYDKPSFQAWTDVYIAP
jgi:hypothetical protein